MDSGKSRVLVVDDEPNITDLLSAAFGYEGCPMILVPKARPKTVESKRRFPTLGPKTRPGRRDRPAAGLRHARKR